MLSPGSSMKRSSGWSLKGSADTAPQLTSTHHSRPPKASTSWFMCICRPGGSSDGSTSLSHSPVSETNRRQMKRRPPHHPPSLSLS
uniref:Uncharacterized protein n=1 Tax=Arundo donax TaxID=35708 RepID=A0A0A9E7S0_ARUDO